MQKDLDKVILVYCEDDIRYQRAAMRDDKTVEEIQKIDAFQISQAEKIKKSDYVLNNSSTKDDLYSQLELILEKINNIKVD